jgi:hypothetical protein
MLRVVCGFFLLFLVDLLLTKGDIKVAFILLVIEIVVIVAYSIIDYKNKQSNLPVPKDKKDTMSQEDKDMVNYWLITTQNEWDEERKHKK